jgi:beta-lactamase class C
MITRRPSAAGTGTGFLGEAVLKAGSRRITLQRLGAVAVVSFLGTFANAAESGSHGPLEPIVDEAVQPVMQEHKVPGMAVAVTVRGKRYFFNYGVASQESGRSVTEDTIFEIGSVSKTFTAILASYAQARGALSLSDKVSKHLPALAGSRFDRINLLDLGTYAAGGLPLQFPQNVTDQEEMIAFYRRWRPSYAVGTHRLYSNPSIGLLGYLAARRMGEPFDDLMNEKLFPMLGLNRTATRVPQDWMGDYASGYSKDDTPIRVAPGILDSQAYGVKTTASDMIRFVEANMNGLGLDATLRRAVAATHTGYFKVGDMIQALGWEMYAYPTSLDPLLAGNSAQMAFQAHKVMRLDPLLAPRKNLLINKTGSTNGFGAYVAFVPAKDIGVVLLANKNYPVPERVKAAYRILTALDTQSSLRSTR